MNTILFGGERGYLYSIFCAMVQVEGSRVLRAIGLALQAYIFKHSSDPTEKTVLAALMCSRFVEWRQTCMHRVS